MEILGMPVAFAAALAAVAFIVILTLVAMSYRIVVPTNAVHIVQSSKARVSYGGVNQSGNTYYRWPAWIPLIGVKVSVLPLSVFDLPLNDYNAYDIGRLPFVIDMMAFFRIDNPGIAAERVSTFEELQSQLEYILKGAARTILATSPIEQIMESRAVFGEKFTQEVEHQLQQWGVVPVKNIELMDIRDAQGSEVIKNIMSKKKSEIERDARVTVAANVQAAQTAEIQAKQQVAINQQEADELVGKRTAMQKQNVGIAQQQAEQAIQDQAAATAEKTMAVTRVNQVRQAEIDRDVATVAANQAKTVATVNAEAAKQVSILEAEGVKAKGEAEGAAQTAISMAPINTQIALAKEIGSNQGYQQYLISVKQVEAGQAVGVAQAAALDKAEVKIIVQAGGPSEGMKSVMDIFTPKGAATVAAAVDTFRNATDVVDAVAAAAAATKSNGTGKPSLR